MNAVQLRAGYARTDITPSYPVPLGGYGDGPDRFHDHVLDPICAVCVAISDDTSTLLLYHLDLVGLPTELADRCRQALSQKHEIPEQNILLNCSHTHSAPDLSSNLQPILRYTEELFQKIVDLAEPALADLAPATVSIGSGQVLGWNFVRRYLLSDGTYGGDNFGDFKNNTILGHEAEADHVMQAVRLNREEKTDILLVNWQGHPQLVGNADHLALSCDVFGRLRDMAEEEHGVYVAFFQGCEGNLNSTSRIKSERLSTDYVEVARGLAEGLSQVLQTMRPVPAGLIKTAQRVFSAPINHAWDHRLEDAERISDFWKTHTHEETRAFAKENGFNSVYHARAVIRRAGMPENLDYTIGAVSFGSVCIVWAPNELFDTTGKFLKETLPFELSFVCGCTNGSMAYMPTIRAFHHGGYGCDVCNYVPGTTEKLTWALMELGCEVR